MTIKPYYQSDRVTLYHGDCLAILPTLGEGSVDAVVTDPPYGVSERCDRKSKGRGCLAECNDFPPVYGDDAPFDPTPWLSFDRVCLWGGNYFADRLPFVSKWLIWDKRDGMNSNDNADCEIAWTNARGPARLLHHRWNGMIKASERADRRVHPTQKPVALMEWCIEQVEVPAGGVVLDPYMGAGATGVACVKTGRRFIGIEIEEKYCEVAAKRIQAAERESAERLVPA